jgi:hypothetical protein
MNSSENRNEEPRILDQSEVHNYEGPTIDVGEPKQDDFHQSRNESGFSGSQWGSRIKVYQSNNSCLMTLGIIILVILGLIFLLPVALLILAVILIGRVIRQALK